MIDLPKLPSSIRVTVADGQVTFLVRPLSKREYVALMDEYLARVPADLSALEADSMTFRLPMARLVDLVAGRIVGAEGLTVDGQPFDPSDPAHFDTLPVQWVAEIASRVMEYASLGPEERKNSEASVGV